eukprot:UN11537
MSKCLYMFILSTYRKKLDKRENGIPGFTQDTFLKPR